ncbi:mitochondrial aspartate-glutamate transporter agc1 [Exophiala dermatitidis]|uniref:Mitochondrial aspartate-glutamate transporter AGC1 n=2 Tax=Exophiala dermatitidis TaxID=5970 RepID=H6C7E4_EXODN|nr:olfactory receptor [Exophiala dermatitidis NIH/UT8656]KAJ4522598.1 mitochondrial aspartate-glutamate transporter agc1 [Exophiala dermatitidis]EHY59640.1 olfactory receptor [Exophiala dermatitidis NIH/UT8656]KAJ4525898.1 mitochondrial aspartate-glutamate transporter agc1 [Exophiala dermatitidis]KAJ4527155.1 mitochondrial aspartate-glutamate transporter agc1 [Exophiala dermatitidis]KAJ4532876.1 mitochondrial aspartate-glutamate transporter agc1 [Exophiala dermatitidis]
MATVTEAVKESLIGATQPESLSTEARLSFLKHSRRGDDGELYMNEEDFIDAIAPPEEDYHKIKREQYGILFNVADRHKRGRISMSEWAAFDNLLAKPDAEYEIAFRLFDVDGTGLIKSEAFQKIYEQNRGRDSIPFDFNSEWATLYIGGKNKRHEMTYPQFAQMMRGLQGERIRQAFHLFDKDKDGYIEPEEFERIIRDTAGHKLSDHVLENLPTLCNISTGSKISYANVRAFQNVIREMDLLDLIIRNATKKSSDGRIDRTDFLNEAARLTRFSLYTPMEADILFHFAGLDVPSGRLSLDDFAKVLDASWQTSVAKLGAISDTADRVVSKSQQFLHSLLESAHHFGLGSIAGAFGAFMVYPIDLVKTRMQNQRSVLPGERLYENSIDCARKVIRNEGFRGLYSGVLPQLVGVAPEKAIKLTVNDLVRSRFTDKQTHAIPIWAELLAGGSAGACQVVFTNPLEIVKIRLQVQGELLKKSDAAPRRSAMWIVRNLGILGLYKGASACLLRDVPFSAIYFPTYNHLKRDMFGESPQKKLGVIQLLTAGAIAGMPAAYLTTPCDVIKTRLQVEARKGDVTYNGLTDCARKIWKQEGFRAFFKGGPARILRSSPQFGFTLAAYEVLSKLLPFGDDEHDAHHAGATAAGKTEPGVGLREAKAPLPYLRSRNALKILLDLDNSFGRVKVPASLEGSRFFSK